MKTESDVIHAADPDPRFLNNSNTIPPAAYFIFSFQHIKKGFKTEQIVKKKKQRTLSFFLLFEKTVLNENNPLIQ